MAEIHEGVKNNMLVPSSMTASTAPGSGSRRVFMTPSTHSRRRDTSHGSKVTREPLNQQNIPPRDWVRGWERPHLVPV